MPTLSKIDHLCVAAPSLTSETVVIAANRRYLSGWNQLERVLGIPERQRLTRILSNFPSATRHLFLMSPSFRSIVDEINTLLDEGLALQQVRILYESAANPFVAAVTRAHDLRILGDSLHTVGFDLANRITDPFPFAVSVWRPPSSSARAEWSESLEVEKLFSRHMSEVAGAQPCVLRSIPSLKAEMFLTAQTILAEISTMAAKDVALNVRYVAYIDYGSWADLDDGQYREIGQSISSHLVPSCCFFSTHSFTSIDRLVEGLFHEALHKKLSNTLVAFEFLAPDFANLNSPKFFSYWNVDTKWNSNLWEFDRALYAYHVYVHLAALYDHLALVPHKSFPESTVQSQLNKCIERASALGKWVLNEGKSCLTNDGLSFTRMLYQHIPIKK